MKTETDYSAWVGTEVIDADGEPIGDIKEVYVDDVTRRPDWVTVSTKWFGTGRQFVPISGADIVDERVKIPYSIEHVKNAPSIDVDDDHLDVRSERRLYEHYGLIIEDGPRSSSAN